MGNDKRRPRKPGRELTPSDAQTPTDRSFAPKFRPTPTAKHLAAAAAKLPYPARPGIRDNSPSEHTVTSRIERIPEEKTPAPLPPSPAAEAADVWFDSVPTNPAAAPDFAALGLGTNPGGARRDPTSKVRKVRERTSADPWGARNSRTYPQQGQQRPWVLPALIAATALTVGMVLGALLFGGGTSRSPETSPGANADCACPDKTTQEPDAMQAPAPTQPGPAAK